MYLSEAIHTETLGAFDRLMSDESQLSRHFDSFHELILPVRICDKVLSIAGVWYTQL